MCACEQDVAASADSLEESSTREKLARAPCCHCDRDTFLAQVCTHSRLLLVSMLELSWKLKWKTLAKYPQNCCWAMKLKLFTFYTLIRTVHTALWAKFRRRDWIILYPEFSLHRCAKNPMASHANLIHFSIFHIFSQFHCASHSQNSELKIIILLAKRKKSVARRKRKINEEYFSFATVSNLIWTRTESFSCCCGGEKWEKFSLSNARCLALAHWCFGGLAERESARTY